MSKELTKLMKMLDDFEPDGIISEYTDHIGDHYKIISSVPMKGVKNTPMYSAEKIAVIFAEVESILNMASIDCRGVANMIDNYFEG